MKHTAKFLCMALSLVMLFAMSVPAMAEGTINKLEYTLNVEDFEDGSITTKSTTVPVVTEENGNQVLKMQGITTEKDYGIYIGESNASNAVSDYVYEAGFKIKLTNPGKASTLNVQLLGTGKNYPLLNNLKFVSYASHNYDYRFLRSSTLIADRNDGLITGDQWNDIRFKITESTSANTLTYDVYINNVLCYTRDSESVTDLNDADKAASRNPYRWVFYYDTADTTPIYIDDVYIAKYIPVENNINRTVKVVKGQNAVLPATINGAAVTWGAIDEETNTATGLLDGYAVDVRATATIQEIDMPYTAAVSDGNLTITKETSYAPAAKIYGATYVGNKLTAVNEIGTIAADEAWNGATKTVSMGSHSKAFIWDSALTPLANIAE